MSSAEADLTTLGTERLVPEAGASVSSLSEL